MNSKEVRKRLLIITLTISITLVGGIGTYIILKIPREIESYSINSIKNTKKVLIVTQDSAFKEAVLKRIANYYNGRDVYLSIVDVSQLSNVKSKDWDKIVILSAIIRYKLNSNVDEFLKKENDYSKVFMYNTSTSTVLKNERTEIDAITSASVESNVDKCSSAIIKAIDNVTK